MLLVALPLKPNGAHVTSSEQSSNPYVFKEGIFQPEFRHHFALGFPD